MKAIHTIFISLLLLTPGINAQDPGPQRNPNPPAVVGRLSLLSPKLIAEFAPSDHFTLHSGFWLRTSFWTSDAEGDPVYRPMISPSLTISPRYYFNLEQRRAKGKRTDYFSGWFIGVPFAIEFPDLRFSSGAVLGFQRTLGKRWYWNISAGPGLTYADSHFFLDGAGDLTLGIILNKM